MDAQLKSVVTIFGVESILTKMIILMRERKLVMHGYIILHTGDLNENDNFINEKLVMRHEIHGNTKFGWGRS